MSIEMKCTYCIKTYQRHKNLQRAQKAKNNFCSRECHCNYNREFQRVTKPCSHCGKEVSRPMGQMTKNLTDHIFCNRSCSAKYKLGGVRVSKLELYLQKLLPELYPDINFVFNGREAILSELDIYIPEYKLAFELNGIYHYEPIYGQDKLDKIVNNDGRKFQACLERGIELVIIDSSSMNTFKEHKAQPFVDIIKKLIDLKVAW